MLLGSWQGNTFRPLSTLTLHTINGLNLAVDAFPSKACELDLSDVKEIDSIGVAVVMNMYRQAQKQGVSLTIHGADDRIRRLFILYELPFSV